MTYDLMTIGRVSMDLFSLQIGAPFSQIESFDAGVGGSPTNIAIGTSRLGLKTVALTAVGHDPVGDFVLHFLENEGVITKYIPRKDDARTGLAVLGIEPPDKFPLVFYRENPADIYLSIDDIDASPLSDCRALLMSGTALSRGTCRDATLYAVEVARRSDTKVFMDLDVRPDQWNHPRGYGINIRAILPYVDAIIGTEEEFYAALAPNPNPIMQGQSLNETLKTELYDLIDIFRTAHQQITIILKQGADGVRVYQADDISNVAGFPVEIVNTVGAGDAFASGLIFAYLQGRDWLQSAQFANACGAIVVTRHGCAKAMPYSDEVNTFIEQRAG